MDSILVTTQGGAINFSFDFDGSDYGLSNYLSIQKLTPTGDDKAKIVANSFTQPVLLNNLEQVAYLISGKVAGQSFCCKCYHCFGLYLSI